MGWSGDLDGNYAVLGAYRYSTDTKYRVGAAFVFKRTGSVWEENSILLPENARVDGNVGYDVAISGDIIAIAAPKSEVDAKSEAGVVYIYEKDNSETWNLTATITSPTVKAEERFGQKVSVDGDVLAITAPGFESRTGKTFLYKRQSNTSWMLLKEVSRNNANESDNYGVATSVKGNNLIVGSDHGSDIEGAVYIYNLSNTLSNEEVINMNKNITIYPNPTSDIVYVKDNSNTNYELSLFNVLGERVKKSSQSYIHIKDLPKGVYVLKIKGANASISKKIIKK